MKKASIIITTVVLLSCSGTGNLLLDDKSSLNETLSELDQGSNIAREEF